MKKYVVKEYASSIISIILSFGVMVLLGYFFDGKKLTADNFIFATIVSILFIAMDLFSAYRRKKKIKNSKADA